MSETDGFTLQKTVEGHKNRTKKPPHRRGKRPFGSCGGGKIGKATALFPESLEIPKNAKRNKKRIAQPNDLKILFSCSQTLHRKKVVEDWYIHAYRFALLTGLRPGELLGLRWEDVRGDHIVIQQALNDFGEITPGKNENAQRPLSIKGMAQEELNAQRKMLRQAGIVSEYVFASPEASFTRQERYREAWNRYCDFHGIQRITPYEMRHTYVSINDEMPDGLKKKALGHSVNMDTEGVYGHIKSGDLERIAAYSDNAIRKIIGK